MRARPIGLRIAAAAALLAAFAGWAAAADRAVTLPLQAPAGVDPLTADFIEICSAGLTDVAKGAALATARAWSVGNGEPGDRNDGFATGAMALLGSFGAAKEIGGGSAFLSINRVPFPHLSVTNCLVNAMDSGSEGIETAPIGRIAGIRGGGGVVSLALPKAGFWSFVDGEGEIVTISAIPLGNRGFNLSMARSVRLDPDTGLPLLKDQTAR